MSLFPRFIKFLTHPNRIKRWLPLLAFLSLFGYQIDKILQLEKDFGPYYGDEYFYLQNAKSFIETGELQASFTYSGKGSQVGGFDAHGPAYPILYGELNWKRDWSGRDILYVNYLIFGIGLILIFSQKENFEHKLLQGILLLGSPYILFYGQSLMPELIQAGIAIFIYLGIRKIHPSSPKSDLLRITVLILIFACFRSTWFFAQLAFGLILFPKQKGIGVGLLSIGLLGLLIFPSYFHEQTPNVFSDTWSFLSEGKWNLVWNEIAFNTKRNLYFLLTYSEGKFYWAWKIWILISLILGLVFFKKWDVLKFGLIQFLLHLIFAIVLYKTYRWTDWRILSPPAILLNLILIRELKLRTESLVLILSSCVGFVLMIPFQQKILKLRNEYSPISVDQQAVKSLENLDPSLIRIDTLILKDYDLRDLPVKNREGKPLRYTLPYYELEEAFPDYILETQGDQLIIRSAKILPQ